MNSTSSAILAPGVHRGIPAEEYHEVRAVSATLLKRFLLDTPAHAKAMLDGRLDEESSAMSKGTALHAALLEPDTFDAMIAIGPDVSRNTREWKDWSAANAGKLQFKPGEAKDITGMRESIWADAYCADCINKCDERELTIIWTDPTTGLLCKARIDLFSTSRRMLLDVKTTGDITRFHKTAYDQAYDVQLAMYAKALNAVGMTAHATGILAVEQSAPYLPEVFEPRPDHLALAFDLIDRAMIAIAECFKTGVWPGYRNQNTKARKLDVPNYPRPISLDRGNNDE